PSAAAPMPVQFRGPYCLGPSLSPAPSTYSAGEQIEFLELHPDNKDRVLESVIYLRNEPDVPVSPVHHQQSLLAFVKKQRRHNEDVVEFCRLGLDPDSGIEERS